MVMSGFSSLSKRVQRACGFSLQTCSSWLCSLWMWVNSMEICVNCFHCIPSTQRSPRTQETFSTLCSMKKAHLPVVHSAQYYTKVSTWEAEAGGLFELIMLRSTWAIQWNTLCPFHKMKQTKIPTDESPHWVQKHSWNTVRKWSKINFYFHPWPEVLFILVASYMEWISIYP